VAVYNGEVNVLAPGGKPYELFAKQGLACDPLHCVLERFEPVFTAAQVAQFIAEAAALGITETEPTTTTTAPATTTTVPATTTTT
jgi:hypothetical protein